MSVTRIDLPERTFEFARRIVLLCVDLHRVGGVNRPMANQLLRSATSIGANVEEGRAGHSRADFVYKTSIALKEARETYYWLRLLSASGLATDKQLDGLMNEASQLVAILTATVKTARKNSSTTTKLPVKLHF